MTQDEMLTEILRREGWDKYTNHPADKGGPTRWGITLAAWSSYIARQASAEDVQAIKEPQAREFYRIKYIERPRFDQIADEQLRELMVDCGVNHGPGNPSTWAQAFVGVKQDGAIGPITLAAINSAAPLALFLWVTAQRVRLYGRLVSNDARLKDAIKAGFRLQAENAAGWNNRAAGFLETSARAIEAAHKAARG